MSESGKILSFEEMVAKVASLRTEGKIVVQSHGVYDLIYPGTVRHLNCARQEGDVLIVSVIKDKDVRKGPGRPLFNEQLRLENVCSLAQVDYACIVDDERPFECIDKIKPTIFAKGQSKDLNLYKEIYETEFNFEESRVIETDSSPFGSTHIIKNFLDIYPDETKSFLREFSKKYSFSQIMDYINALSGKRVLLIGDGIIDEYHYCSTMGKSLKAHLVVNKYQSHEVFAGGAFAIANHLAGICGNVGLVTILGHEHSYEDFIINNLKPNVSPTFFFREDSPTIVKKRYVNQYLNQKLFEINYLNDTYIEGELQKNICNFLKKEASNYDIVLVSDFGHGFITKEIISTIEGLPGRFTVNTQMNAANSGYNVITKYDRPFFVCLDEPEIRLAAQDKYSNIEDVARKVIQIINADNLIVTLGKNGSIGLDRQGNICRTPIFSSKVVDTVGAGDAFFSYTAPCISNGVPLEICSFIGNSVGAIAVQIVGNKRPVEKNELLGFIYNLLR